MNVNLYAKMLIGVAMFAVLILGFRYFDNNSINASDDVASISSNGVTTINLSFDTRTYNYNPNVIKVKSGEKIRIVGESSIPGCYKFFQIPDLKLSKYFDGADNTLEFTAPAPGRYTYTCSMGMGQGVLIVE